MIPENFTLHQNYPNPFNPTTNIKFELPNMANVELNVYNMMGQKIATLISGNLRAGVHHIHWNASDIASGIYFYRLEAGSMVVSKKLTLLK